LTVASKDEDDAAMLENVTTDFKTPYSEPVTVGAKADKKNSPLN